MPFTFVQPVDLGGSLPPLPAVVQKVGPQAPPPLPPIPSKINVVPMSRIDFVVRTSAKQWTRDQAVAMIKAIVVASNNMEDCPDNLFTSQIANALFNEQPTGSFYRMIMKGIAVYRPEVDLFIEEVLYHANHFGQHFVINHTTSLDQYLADQGA